MYVCILLMLILSRILSSFKTSFFKRFTFMDVYGRDLEEMSEILV